MKSLDLVVVAGNGPSLLGRNWLRHIQLEWKQIKAVAAMPTNTPTALAHLLDKYQEVFKNDQRTITTHEVKILVRDDA